MKQRGFGVVAQLVAGGVVLALASGAFAYYNHVVSERARLEVELSDAVKAEQEQAAVAERLRGDVKRRDALLAAREGERQAAIEERGKLNAELEELRKRPEVAAWMAGDVPAALLERVRGPAHRAPDAGGAAVSPGQPGAANAGAKPAR